MNRNPGHRPDPRWWRHGMLWLVVGGPAVVVVAGFATLAIALAHPDPVMPTTDRKPAVQARNHAASPVATPAPRP
ncbi:MAG TPA: nitrogen fixation protein FixH [Burkholderiaceae bacterium]|nr:nitrogen fixation protein FixH [Burkholderiaceae bacterium]